MTSCLLITSLRALFSFLVRLVGSESKILNVSNCFRGNCSEFGDFVQIGSEDCEVFIFGFW